MTPCTRCRATDGNKRWGGLCTDCERERIRDLPTVDQACDECKGQGPVLRDPVHRKNLYLCRSCRLAPAQPAGRG